MHDLVTDHGVRVGVVLAPAPVRVTDALLAPIWRSLLRLGRYARRAVARPERRYDWKQPHTGGASPSYTLYVEKAAPYLGWRG